MNTARIELQVIDLERPPNEVLACRRLLTKEEAARADRFVRGADRDRWTVCRGHVRAALAGYCQVEPADIDFNVEGNGKPVLASPDVFPGVFFNLSHSGAVALLGMTSVAPLGVDVEHMRDVADRDAIVERFFSPVERSAYLAVPHSDRRQAFYNGWTRKEAIIKATGEGLSADLSAFDVSLAPGEPARVITIDGQRAGAARWQMFDLTPRPGYVGAVALQSACPVVVDIVQAGPIDR